MEIEIDEINAVESREQRRYFIDVDWYDQHSLSFTDIVQTRMCRQCQTRLGEEIEERYPVADRRTGRVTYQVRSVRYGARPMAALRDCCSRKSGYISPDMPILEAIFRILLANANQPMPLEHMREQLREWCPTGRCQWLLMPMDVLAQVVDRDRSYGLRLHEVPEVV